MRPLLLAVIAAAGCTEPGPYDPLPNDPPTTMEEARTVWEAEAPAQGYRATYQRGCAECDSGGLHRTRVTVQDGVVTSAVIIYSGDPVPSITVFKPVDALFDEMEQVLADPDYQVSVAFDELLGFPTRFSFVHREIADLLASVEISELEPL